MSNYDSYGSGEESPDMECSSHDSMKFFTTLMKFNKNEMSNAEEILHTIACSTDYIDWNAETMEVIVNKKVLKGSNIVELVEYLLYTENENKDETFGLSEFVEALKEIGLESKWIFNRKIASELNEYDSSDSSSCSSDEEIDENSNCKKQAL